MDTERKDEPSRRYEGYRSGQCKDRLAKLMEHHLRMTRPSDGGGVSDERGEGNGYDGGPMRLLAGMCQSRLVYQGMRVRSVSTVRRSVG